MRTKTASFGLDIRLSPATGQILAATDRRTGLEILRGGAAAELTWNGRPLQTRPVDSAEGAGERIDDLESAVPMAYGAGATLRVRRVLTLGGVGLHSGPSDSLHVRYEVRRVPHGDRDHELDYIWRPSLEAPLRLETLDVPGLPLDLFGPATRLRAIAAGGSGPREHVGVEDGPVAEVLPHLQAGFRRAFPGQPSVAGGLFYEPRDERFVWVMVRRATTGGELRLGGGRHDFRFHYFRDFRLQDQVETPAVSYFWGRGLDRADRVLAAQFDLYEEPPPWWYRTTWFWLHPNWQRDASFGSMAEGARVLMDQAGVNGFGLFAHDVPWSGNDCDVGSPRPSPGLGGDAALRRAVQEIRDRGGHTYVWMSRCGARADGLAWRDSWAIRGVDGRPVRLHNRPDSGVRLDIINPADPTFEDHICRWIEYYVRHLGVTGVFWDSGAQPLPPDFGDKPYLRWPGETSARVAAFYEKVYRFGRSLSDDFFMWVEGISVDLPMNAFAVDGRVAHGLSAHRLMHRLAHAGPRRLVWRSCWRHDLASGFPFIDPPCDIGWPARPAPYAKAAADPMNRWICRTVRERGVREAVGLGDGISLLDEFVVASPGAPLALLVPAQQCRGTRLTHVLDGTVVRGRRTPDGVRYRLPRPGAYAMG